MFRIIILTVTFVFLVGCGSSEDRNRRELEALYSGASLNLDQLKSKIDAGLIRNAKYIDSYAKVILSDKPELAEIVNLISIDATSKSPVFESMVSRLGDARGKLTAAISAGGDEANKLKVELDNLQYGSSASVYDAMLADSVNVLADMSDGKLSRVSSLSKSESLSANGAEDMGVGSQYVGNPNYGNWQTNSSGGSFWEWYGKYALFSSLFNRGPIGYGYWSSNRDYSYYNDSGRNYYSSPAQKTTAAQTETRTRKSFASQGRSFNSPYAKQKSSGTRSTSLRSTTSRVSSNSSSSAYNSRTSSSPFARSRSSSSGGK